MAVNGKQKGNEAERELAKILSTKLGGVFTRSNNSGAFVGGKNVHRKKGLGKAQMMSLKGDLCPPDEMPRLVVESKFYNPAKVSYEQMLWKPVAILDKWVDQARSSSDEGDLWLVCFKTNLRPWMVALSADEFVLSGGTFPDPEGTYVAHSLRYRSDLAREIVLMPLDAFLSCYGEFIRARCAPIG